MIINALSLWIPSSRATYSNRSITTIFLNNYLDLDKVIKTSTIPLSKLEFNYNNNCEKAVLSIKYKDFKVDVDVVFNCEDYPKSKVRVGKTKSFKREIFSILFKTLFLRKL